MKHRPLINMGILLIALLIATSVACGGDSEESPPTTTESPTSEEGITTESGLRYIEIEEGTGLQAQAGDAVEVHYTGTLEDGYKFDSSLDRGQPLPFVVGMGQMIPGFDEGVALMKEGGKARLAIPPELGYGNQQKGDIPANSTLIFEIELLSLQRPESPTEVDESDYEVTESGLKYYDFTVGEGASPEDGASIMDFAIWVLNGMPLGNSQDQGQPLIAILGSGSLLPGWEEGVSTMKVGGKRQMVIPPELAFGEEGAGETVPPNSTLIVEVELLTVIPVPEPADRTEVDESDYEVTESGLKYYDIVAGKGASPEMGQQVIIHYTGWLTNGTMFDNSIDRGLPLAFALGMEQMIAGFDEGVATMKAGCKRQLVIPPELGYGDQEQGPIPANSTLIFEVELMYVY
jgi:peptidylprolyl isomerase